MGTFTRLGCRRSVVAAAILAPAAFTAAGHGDGPRLWTWDRPPLLSAVPQGRIVPIMRRNAGVTCAVNGDCCVIDCGCVQRTPEQVVAGIVAEYQQLPIFYVGGLNILLQEVGQGHGDPCPTNPALSHLPYVLPLFLHWCDALDATADGAGGCAEPAMSNGDWLTPWMDEGIVEARPWMEGFVDALAAAIDAGQLPAPTRFQFDVENWPMATYWQDLGPISFLRMAGLDAAASPDPRWDTVPVPGLGQTMASLYADALADGVTQPVPDQWSVTANHAWTAWYDGLMMSACDGAVSEAFFDPIRAAWPETRPANFDTSIRADGGAVAADTPRRVFRNRRHASADWYVLTPQGSSDLQSPELYIVSDQHHQPGETPELASVRVHRANVEACLQSFGGWPVERFTPWVPNIGAKFKIFLYQPTAEYVVNKTALRNLLVMLRSKGVDELNVFSGPPLGDPTFLESWLQLQDLVRQVWDVDLVDAQVVAGSEQTPAAERVARLGRGDWDWQYTGTDGMVSVQSVPEDGAHVATLVASFDALFDCAVADRLAVVVDGRTHGPPAGAPPATLAVELWNPAAGAWDPLDATIPAADAYEHRFDRASRSWRFQWPLEAPTVAMDGDRRVVQLIDHAAWQHVDADGTVQVRLRWEGPAPFTADTDLVQIAEADEERAAAGCRADCHPPGGDGVVDVQDLVEVILAWSGGGRCDLAPACGNGVVDVQDLVEVILQWGPCAP